MSGPFKMRGSSMLGHGNQHSSTKGMPFASPAKQSIVDASQSEKNIKELNDHKSNLLSSDDLQANQDTIHQNNIQYMNKNWQDSGPVGVIKRNHIKGNKDAQSNKNISTSGNELSDASSRSSARIGNHKTAVDEGDIDQRIKVNQARINQRESLKKGLKKFSPPKPKPKAKKKSGWLGLPDMGVTEFLGINKKRS